MTEDAKIFERSPIIRTLVVVMTVAVSCALPPAHEAIAADATQAGSQAKQRSEPRLRASSLLGSDVRNVQDKSLGKVSDLLIDLSRGVVRYVIVESGGAFGVGGKLFAFPLRDFGAGRRSDEVVLNIDEQKLKSAPGFARDTQTGWGKYEDALDRYFGIDQPARTPASRNLQLATQIIRVSNVIDRNGAKAGTVVDMVLNHMDGRLAYLVMQLDRGLDAHTRLLPLPLTAFYFGHSGGPPVLDIPVTRIDTRFAFDDKQWPDINDPDYQQRLGAYLGRVTQHNPAPTPPNSDGAPTARDKPVPR